jgi:opacity protein-like surface antigen
MKNLILNKFNICKKSKNLHPAEAGQSRTPPRIHMDIRKRSGEGIAKKKLCVFFASLRLCVMLFLFARPLFAQGYGGPLTFQGLDRYSLHSASARAMGGVAIGVKQDIGLMFQNPATLQSMQAMHVSLGGLQLSKDLEQEQNYAPVRYYPNLSLLLEGLTARIPNPDTTLVGFTAQDTVQRPFDDIAPNWSHSKNRTMPLQALLAAPVSSGDFKIVAGVGAVEYANLGHFYQNNNVLSPAILSQRPLPTFRPTDNNPMEVEWSQSARSREGSIQGYGVALAGSVEKYNLSVGLSGMILNGSTDDYEQQISRGRLTFFSNAFRADSVYGRITKTGTSDFSGKEFTLSSILTGRHVSIGFSIKLPTTITRKYTMQVQTDTTGTPSLSTIHGEDKLKLPWRGTIGLSLAPKEKLTIGLEYEFRPYKSVRYIDSNGEETSPWLSASLLRVGAEYMIAPWLALRGGMRGEAEVFEPEGNHLEGEPVTYTVYSAGFGVFYSGLRLNVAYENSMMKYQDIWASAISKNSDRRHAFLAQVIYEISWMR